MGDILSEIGVEPALAEGLRGMEQFSHVIVLYHMHRTEFDPPSDLVRRPRGRPDMPLVGVFAQRAKHRPHSIGVTTVRIVSLEGTLLRVKGLDPVDGTPVLEVKPYVPAYETAAGAVVPEWMQRLMEGYF